MKRTGFKQRSAPMPRGKPLTSIGQVLQRQHMRKKSKKRVAYEATPEGIEDAAYLADLHKLPCVICDAFGMMQLSPTTAHHWIVGRHGTKRTPCKQALPLCDGHHQGKFDTSKIAIHREPAAWREAYGKDSDYIQVTQDKVAEMVGLL